MQFIDETVCHFLICKQKTRGSRNWTLSNTVFFHLVPFHLSHSAPHKPKRANGSRWSGPKTLG